MKPFLCCLTSAKRCRCCSFPEEPYSDTIKEAVFHRTLYIRKQPLLFVLVMILMRG
ncbi:hypothetical protein EVA_08982 [gut metagenome]|uniref:Uncharacterized protein n=1 Tax=gut metagenome TaxID=749906 RepID=J9G6N0_9ZZZZ